MPADARQTALSVLNTWDEGRRPLDQVLEKAFAAPGLDRQNLRLANALVYGVFRWRSQLDWIIGQAATKPPGKIDPPILNILRLGVFQIRFLDGIPDSAAVNTAVELAKKFAAPWTVRFVNGVLRGVIRKGENLQWPSTQSDPVAALAVTRSFPSWLVKRWLDRFGPDETTRLCDAMNAVPPITLRTNLLRTSREILLQKLANEAQTVYATGHAPEGISLRGPDATISRLPGFQEGWFQVQDQAAQLVTALVAPQPGESILDACAGLGGKTGHLAQKMENRGRITALDSSAPKLDRLMAEMDRLGMAIVKTVRHDLETSCASPGGELFDRILLDAPCSGLGVLRRNPDAKWVVQKQAGGKFGERQLRFLSRLAGWTKPSGKLVYAVCTFEKNENEDVVRKFLSAHSDFRLVREKSVFAPEVRPFLDENGFFRTYPHLHDMDGFFAAVLERRQ